MADPQAQVMDIIFGRWRSQVLYAATRLGIFDEVAGGPAEVSAVARRLSLDPALTYRLMRAAASLGLLDEGPGRTFTLTTAGDLLRRDHPQTLRGVTLLEEGPEHYALWKHLPSMVREGQQNAFMREFGRMAFEHADYDPSYAEVFNGAMTSYSNSQTAWAIEALDGIDFASIKSLCDVGGGQGHMLCSFLMKYPHLRGIVFDLPSVVAKTDLLWAERMAVAERCEYVGGDMFAAIPAAEAYMMKMILHDWDDDECVQILKNVGAAAPSGGRLFVIEHIIPDPGTPHFAKFFDIHMMCWGTGRERTAEEYATLMERAGWRYEGTRHPAEGLMGAVVGIRA